MEIIEVGQHTWELLAEIPEKVQGWFRLIKILMPSQTYLSWS